MDRRVAGERAATPAPTQLVLVLAAVVLLSVACAPGAKSGAGDLDRFYGQQLSWGSCASFAVSDDDRKTFADAKFDCAYLQVPLDYGQPDGPPAKISVLRQKASVPAQRIGSLVINPGGPGASGTSAAAGISQQIDNSVLAQRFDLIGFDPRGVGASQPAIKCYTPAERDAMPELRNARATHSTTTGSRSWP